MLLVFLSAMVPNLWEDFTPLRTRITFPDGKTTVFADTTSKLPACHPNIEFLTEFTSVFIDDIRQALFRHLILECESVTDGITVSVDNPKRNLGVELSQKLSQLTGNSRTCCSQEVSSKVTRCFGYCLSARLLFTKGGIKFIKSSIYCFFN